MEKLKLLLVEHRERLLGLDNVIGVGVGFKEKGGQVTGEPAIVTMVTKKQPEDTIFHTQMVPPDVQGVPTDVIEVGRLRLLETAQPVRTSFRRPAQPGLSIGHFKTTAGTFGAVVYDKQTKEPLILSNNHVLANLTNGQDGRSSLGDLILQPGAYDGGDPQKSAIAKLYKFIPVHYTVQSSNGEKTSAAPAENNFIDAALGRPLSPDLITGDILGIGKVKGVVEPQLGMWVQKSGRTSGITTGKIKVVHSTLKVEVDDDKYATFEDQVVSTMISDGGDSGSLVLDRDNNAVGLLFAGSKTVTVFNPISKVCDALGVTFDLAGQAKPGNNGDNILPPNLGAVRPGFEFFAFLVFVFFILGNRIFSRMESEEISKIPKGFR